MFNLSAFFLSLSVCDYFHIVSVNVLSPTIVRVSSDYCPCGNFFVDSRMLGYAQPSPRADVGWGCYVSLLIISIMAIINSLAIGKSVKSAGNLTYKTVRGRTIASQRITSNASNTPLQASQRTAFGRSIQCMQLVLPFINNFFEKSKYGSARNQFLKLNKKYLLGGFYGEITEGVIPLVEGFAIEAQAPGLTGGLHYASYGTLPAVVQETASADAEITINETPYAVNAAASTLYNFTGAAKDSDVRILFYGFIKPTPETAELTLSPIYKSYTLDEVAKLASECYMKANVTKDDSGIVSSIKLSPVTPFPTGFGYMIGYCVVSVQGKLPRTNKIFILTQ